MGRQLLAVLLLIFGAGSVLMHNSFSFSQMRPIDFAVMGSCMVVSLLLFFWKKGNAEKSSDEIHTMTFSLDSVTNFTKGKPSVQQGQQLYLKPYEGENHEQIAITNDEMDVLGFIPSEYQKYVLSRIESHRLTHTVAKQVSDVSFGSYTILVCVTC